MSSRRLIDSSIWQDDWFGSIGCLQRLMWIGLFTAADDQGRMLDNPAIIIANVFPYDKITTDQIETSLAEMASAGKIIRYTANGKRLLQIANWWKYQAPAWATASKFPAPEGWVDRYKYHGQGNKIHMANWDQRGGYPQQSQPKPKQLPTKEITPPQPPEDSTLHSQLHSQLHSPIEEDKRKTRGEESRGEKVNRNTPRPSGPVISPQEWEAIKADIIRDYRPTHDLITALHRAKPIGGDPFIFYVPPSDVDWLQARLAKTLASVISAVNGSQTTVVFQAG